MLILKGVMYLKLIFCFSVLNKTLVLTRILAVGVVVLLLKACNGDAPDPSTETQQPNKGPAIATQVNPSDDLGCMNLTRLPDAEVTMGSNRMQFITSGMSEVYSGEFRCLRYVVKVKIPHYSAAGSACPGNSVCEPQIDLSAGAIFTPSSDGLTVDVDGFTLPGGPVIVGSEQTNESNCTAYRTRVDVYRRHFFESPSFQVVKSVYFRGYWDGAKCDVKDPQEQAIAPHVHTFLPPSSGEDIYRIVVSSIFDDKWQSSRVKLRHYSSQ